LVADQFEKTIRQGLKPASVFGPLRHPSASLRAGFEVVPFHGEFKLSHSRGLLQGTRRVYRGETRADSAISRSRELNRQIEPLGQG
jgi:hypothetical protein